MPRKRKKRREPCSNRWFGFLHAFAAQDADQPGPLPDLNVADVLAWADAYHARTGQWPRRDSGPIPESPGETWLAVEAALCLGQRGFPGGSTLPRLLAEHRGVRNRKGLPALTVKRILAWADAHWRRYGEWPTISSRTIAVAPWETRLVVHALLSNCIR